MKRAEVVLKREGEVDVRGLALRQPFRYWGGPRERGNSRKRQTCGINGGHKETITFLGLRSYEGRDSRGPAGHAGIRVHYEGIGRVKGDLNEV